MRAFVAKTFPAYTFEVLDRLSMERVIEMYSTALWISVEEEKSAKTYRRRNK